MCYQVTDFGLSIEKDGVGTDSMMEDYCGTPMYMCKCINVADFIDQHWLLAYAEIWCKGNNSVPSAVRQWIKNGETNG